MIAYMLVARRPFINNFVNSRAELWTQKCAKQTLAHCVCTTFHGNASHTCVQHHCMVMCMLVCVWLYLYDCMCMIVWQCAHDVIVKITRLLGLVTTYNPRWPHVCIHLFDDNDARSNAEKNKNFQTVGDSTWIYFGKDPGNQFQKSSLPAKLGCTFPLNKKNNKKRNKKRKQEDQQELREKGLHCDTRQIRTQDHLFVALMGRCSAVLCEVGTVDALGTWPYLASLKPLQISAAGFSVRRSRA